MIVLSLPIRKFFAKLDLPSWLLPKLTRTMWLSSLPTSSICRRPSIPPPLSLHRYSIFWDRNKRIAGAKVATGKDGGFVVTGGVPEAPGWRREEALCGRGETTKARGKGARIPSRLLVSSDCFASIRWWCLYGYHVSLARSLIPRRNTKQMKRHVSSFVLLTSLPHPQLYSSISLRYVCTGRSILFAQYRGEKPTRIHADSVCVHIHTVLCACKILDTRIV